MSLNIAARLFVLAHDAEMLADGYAWVVTDSVGNMFSTLDENPINSMQGVLGVRPYVPIMLHNRTSSSHSLLDFCHGTDNRTQQHLTQQIQIFSICGHMTQHGQL
jgi:hypothetical protein